MPVQECKKDLAYQDLLRDRAAIGGDRKAGKNKSTKWSSKRDRRGRIMATESIKKTAGTFGRLRRGLQLVRGGKEAPHYGSQARGRGMM